jgi:hypothetical protein
MMVIQTPGRHGRYNPHRHLIATSGGWDRPAKRWVHLDDLPYRVRRKQGPWDRLTMLRQTVQTKAITRLVNAGYPRYRAGCVTNVHKGDVPARDQRLARYLAQYVVRPPLSLRRLDGYAGHHVTDHYRSHTSERVERERVAVSTCIGRMVPHTFPKGCPRIRYYGVPATKTLAKSKGMIPAAVAQVQGVVTGAVHSIAPLTYRQR